MKKLEFNFANQPHLSTSNNTSLPWITLSYYCQLTGDTKQAVYARKKKGSWLEGQHYRIAPNRKIWINTNEVQQWLNQSQAMSLPA